MSARIATRRYGLLSGRRTTGTGRKPLVARPAHRREWPSRFQSRPSRRSIRSTVITAGKGTVAWLLNRRRNPNALQRANTTPAITTNHALIPANTCIIERGISSRGDGMSFVSVLETIGKDALKVLHIGEAAAIIAAPVISAQFGPGIGAAVANTVMDVLTAEQAANAAQKAAAVVQSLAGNLPTIEKDFGLTVPADKQAAYVQLVYNLTQLFQPVAPAPPAPAPAN